MRLRQLNTSLIIDPPQKGGSRSPAFLPPPRGDLLGSPTGRDDLVGLVLRYLEVMAGLHGVAGAALGHRAQLGGVAEHLRQRHLGLDDLGHAAVALAEDEAAARA